MKFLFYFIPFCFMFFNLVGCGTISQPETLKTPEDNELTCEQIANEIKELIEMEKENSENAKEMETVDWIADTIKRILKLPDFGFNTEANTIEYREFVAKRKLEARRDYLIDLTKNKQCDTVPSIVIPPTPPTIPAIPIIPFNENSDISKAQQIAIILTERFNLEELFIQQILS